MSENQKEIKTIIIHNKISASFREVHVDGAYGGITPQGLVNLNFFAERTPIPKSSEFEITEEQKVGTLIKHSDDSKSGILREFEFGIYMNIQTAKSIVELLNTKIDMYESLLNNTQQNDSIK